MIQRSFSRTLASLEFLFDFLNQFLTRHLVDSKTGYELQLAIEEVFVNLVKHNQPSSADICVRLSKTSKRITIQIQDFNVQDFDVSQPPNVDTKAPLENRHPGGLGLHLIHNVMDQVKYKHENGTSTITLIKYIK